MTLNSFAKFVRYFRRKPQNQHKLCGYLANNKETNFTKTLARKLHEFYSSRLRLLDDVHSLMPGHTKKRREFKRLHKSSDYFVNMPTPKRHSFKPNVILFTSFGSRTHLASWLIRLIYLQTFANGLSAHILVDKKKMDLENFDAKTTKTMHVSACSFQSKNVLTKKRRKIMQIVDRLTKSACAVVKLFLICNYKYYDETINCTYSTEN